MMMTYRVRILFIVFRSIIFHTTCQNFLGSFCQRLMGSHLIAEAQDLSLRWSL